MSYPTFFEAKKTLQMVNTPVTEIALDYWQNGQALVKIL